MNERTRNYKWLPYADHSGANQQWQLVNASNGYYTLVNRNSGKVLDVPNQVTTAGVQLDQWIGNGGANQQWQLVSAGGGYYTIVGRGSGLLVDVAGASLADVAAVIQAAGTVDRANKSSLRPCPDP